MALPIEGHLNLILVNFRIFHYWADLSDQIAVHNDLLVLTEIKAGELCLAG